LPYGFLLDCPFGNRNYKGRRCVNQSAAMMISLQLHPDAARGRQDRQEQAAETKEIKA
jgi:hypothetical protein